MSQIDWDQRWVKEKIGAVKAGRRFLQGFFEFVKLELQYRNFGLRYAKNFMARANRNFFKKLYRKEPISSFLVVVGLMEVVIGGADEQWSLFSLGLGLVLGAMVVRSSQLHKRQQEAKKMMPRRYLPPGGVPQPLPRLVNDQSPSKNDSVFKNW